MNEMGISTLQNLMNQHRKADSKWVVSQTENLEPAAY